MSAPADTALVGAALIVIVTEEQPPVVQAPLMVAIVVPAAMLAPEISIPTARAPDETVTSVSENAPDAIEPVKLAAPPAQ